MSRVIWKVETNEPSWIFSLAPPRSRCSSSASLINRWIRISCGSSRRWTNRWTSVTMSWNGQKTPLKAFQHSCENKLLPSRTNLRAFAKTLLSTAIGQRSRNHRSCWCCSFLFVSFPLKIDFNRKKSSRPGKERRSLFMPVKHSLTDLWPHGYTTHEKLSSWLQKFKNHSTDLGPVLALL